MGLAGRRQPERGADAKWRWHAANSTQACGYAWRLRGIFLFNMDLVPGAPAGRHPLLVWPNSKTRFGAGRARELNSVEGFLPGNGPETSAGQQERSHWQKHGTCWVYVAGNNIARCRKMD